MHGVLDGCLRPMEEVVIPHFELCILTKVRDLGGVV